MSAITPKLDLRAETESSAVTASTLDFTSAEVSGSPEWKVTSSRSVIV